MLLTGLSLRSPINQLPLPLPDVTRGAETLPAGVDRWIAASTMQKAIRRGDVRVAGQAAISLRRMVGPSIWRRLVIIAFEDVGASYEGALKFTVHAAERRSRGACDERAIQYLARKLASLPKDRTADHLVSIALHHPSVATERLRLHRITTSERIAILLDAALPLPVRATAALMAATRDVDGAPRFDAKGFGEVITAYQDMGLPAGLVETTRRAGRLTRETIALFAPLIRQTALAGGRPQDRDQTTPATASVCGVPTYALDKHTALGKTAIRRFVAESRQMQAVLASFVPQSQWTIATATAAFHADAAPVAHRLIWSGSEELERLGAEADLYRDGVPLDGARPMIECVRSNLDHLNDIRARLLAGRLNRS